MLTRLAAVAATLVLAAAGIVLGVPQAFAGGPAGVVCDGETSVGVGGLYVALNGTYENSAYIGADVAVGYDSLNPGQGLANLGYTVDMLRAECPADHLKLVGHSEGAALVHAWVSAHPFAENVSAVLISDPKRVAGPGWAGLADVPGAWLVGYPLAGVDANFGAVPVLNVCRHDDMVCNTQAGWFGYFTGAHTSYNYSPDAYPDYASGIWFY